VTINFSTRILPFDFHASRSMPPFILVIRFGPARYSTG